MSRIYRRNDGKCEIISEEIFKRIKLETIEAMSVRLKYELRHSGIIGETYIEIINNVVKEMKD